MSAPEQLPLNEVKNRLSEVVERVESEHARVTITKHGRPAAVVISTDDLTALEETLLVLSDPEAMDLIRASRGQTVAAQVLSKEEAARLVGQPE
jgi:antitoxin YefM